MKSHSPLLVRQAQDYAENKHFGYRARCECPSFFTEQGPLGSSGLLVACGSCGLAPAALGEWFPLSS